MNLTCDECGNAFRVPPSQAKRRWCSWACRTARPRAFNAKPRTSRCETCNGLIAAKPSKKRRFCSMECYGAAPRPDLRRRVVCECRNCGAEYEKRPSEIAGGRGKYCSRGCAALGRPIARRSVIGDEAIAQWASTATVPFEAEKRFGRWSIDLAFPSIGVAIELDGEYWHSIPEVAAKDRRKDAALTAAGWTVHRITMDRWSTPTSVAVDIASVLSAYQERVA